MEYATVNTTEHEKWNKNGYARRSEGNGVCSRKMTQRAVLSRSGEVLQNRRSAHASSES